jgi:hypothetical protein
MRLLVALAQQASLCRSLTTSESAGSELSSVAEAVPVRDVVQVPGGELGVPLDDGISATW